MGKPTASFISIPRIAVARARSPRAPAAPAADSARAWSRSSTSARCCTRAAVSCSPSPAWTPSQRTHACASRQPPGRGSAGLRRRVAAVRDLRSPSRGLPAAGQRARPARIRCGSRTARQRAGLPPEAPAGRGHRAQLSACAGAGRPNTSAGSRRRRGVVCNACESGAFYALRAGLWLPGRRARVPAGNAPDGSELTLRQVERAIGDTAEHHAHVRLRPLLAA